MRSKGERDLEASVRRRLATRLRRRAAVAKSANAMPSKGIVRKDLWVRVPPAALVASPAGLGGTFGPPSFLARVRPFLVFVVLR